MDKRKKDRRAVEVILLAVLLLMLLPNMIGKKDVVEKRGNIGSEADLNGLRFAVTADDEALVRDTFPKSELVKAAGLEDKARLLLNGEADVFLADASAARNAAENYPDLTVMPEQSAFFAVVRKSDYSYCTSIRKVEELNSENFRIAVMPGTEQETSVENNLPRAERIYCNSLSDCFMSLESGKADAAVCYYSNLPDLFENYPDVCVSMEKLMECRFGFGLQKNESGDALLAELDEYLERIDKDGEQKRISEKWANAVEGEYSPEEYVFSGEKGILRIATTGVWFPKSFYSGSTLMGEFVDLLNGFASEYGYIPQYESVVYAAEMAGLSSGNYDIIADSIIITDERLETVNISLPILSSNTYLLLKSDEAGTVSISRAKSFLLDLKSSFEKNFLREQRWKMLLSGLGVTAAIAVLAGLFGTALGSAVCCLRMSSKSYARGFGTIYVKLVQGTPVVVLLLVLYYLVFSDSLSAFWVCVVGFSIDFAAYAAEIFRSAIEAVPEGQVQAARALGFTPFGAFRKVTFPQAVTNGLPVFSGQFIAMVKQTSVAGYISVQDLTKISDIIRSRTYEAFFPLITTALIYFAISTILVSVLKRLERRLNPQFRNRKIKGVETDADQT